MRIAAKTYYVTVGAAFLIVILLHLTAVLQPFEDWLRSLFVPLLSDAHGLSIKVDTNYQFFANRDAFLQSYNSCIQTTENCSFSKTKLQLLADENTELRRQLNFFKKKNVAHILVDVVGKELLSIDKTIVIDSGSAAGLAVNDPVVVGPGILVGKIAKVETNTAIVRLLNDNESRVGASVVNKDKSAGVVEGGYGISLQMNLIPRDEVVVAGSQVITSGLERTVPRGLLIGTIAAVENEPYKPFQQAILTPATDLDKLTVVSILLTN